MVYPIYIYGSEVLRLKAQDIDVEKVDREELKTLVADMFETMYATDGIGLAAPQIGKSIRLLVVDGKDVSETYPELKDFKKVMINPVIIKASDETVSYGEGCLSVPNIHCDVVRPKVITVSYLDENLEKKEETFDNFGARMVQHEMDHLDGYLFTDHVSPIRKKMIGSKLQNISKGKVRAYYKTRLEKAR